MTGDEMRDQLAATLAKLWRDDMGGEIDDIPDEAWDEVLSGYLDALLPVVRKIAADELNDLADSIPCSDSELEAKQMARARADALDPS